MQKNINYHFIALAIFCLITNTLMASHKIYIGAGVGASLDNTKLSGSYDDGGSKNFHFAQNLSKQTFTGNLMLGYAYVIQNYLVGVELDVLMGNFKNSNVQYGPGNGGTYSFYTNGSPRIGLATRLGVYIQNFLWYIRLGLEWQKQKLEVNPYPLPLPAITIPQVNITKTHMAIVPGIGTEMKIDESHSIGFEFRTAFYGSFSGSTSPTNEQRVLGVEFPTYASAKKNIHTVLLTYRYSFNLQS